MPSQQLISQPESRIRRRAAFLVAGSLILTLLLYSLWPRAGATGQRLGRVLLFGTIGISSELRLLIIAALASAVANLTLNVAYLFNTSANRDVVMIRPVAIYVVNALFAALLGPMVVILMRALLVDAISVADVNLWGTITMASLAGLFSEQVKANLVGVFRNLFSPETTVTTAATATTAKDRFPETVETALSSDEDLLREEASLRDRYGRKPNVSVAKELINVLRQLNKFDDAAAIYDALISVNPEDDKLLLEKAALYREIGDERRYVEIVRQADQIVEKRSFEENVGKEITLRGIEVRDLSFFADFKWELQPTVNVLLGRNGYGKSHLLRAIVSMLQADKDISGEYFEDSGRQAMLQASVFKGEAAELTIRSRLLFDKSFGKVPVLAIPDMRYIDKSQDSIGPPRTVSDLRSGGARQFMRNESFEGTIMTFLYELCLDYVKHGNTFQAPVFQLMQKVVEDLTESTFAFKEIISKDNARFEIRVITDGNESNPLPIQKASQGTLSVLSMVGLTYRYLRALNPQVAEAALTQQQAVVVIDEIDAHLHPTWQQKILQLFRDTFPRVQFIVTAHTPLVVAGCMKGEVAVLVKSDGKFAVKVMEDHFIGATATSLYRQIFEVEDKDLTYLRLNTLQGTRGDLEHRFSELADKRARGDTLSPDQKSTLEELPKELYYLREAKIVQDKRQNAENAESHRQMLEMEAMNLRGEVSKLKGSIENKTHLAETRELSGLVEFLREFVEANPENAGVIEPFIRYLSRQGGHEQAARLLEALLGSQPDNISYLKGLAIQYEAMQNYKNATVVLRKALALSPRDEGLQLMVVRLEEIQESFKPAG